MQSTPVRHWLATLHAHMRRPVSMTASHVDAALLHVPLLHWLRVRPTQIGPPWLVWGKLTQNQTTLGKTAQAVLGYAPRPLHEILRRNFEWLQRQQRQQQGGERASLLGTR